MYYYEPAPFVASYGSSMVWTGISFILAIIGGILIYVLFLKPDKKEENKFLAWLKDFLNFDKLLIEMLLKVTYIMCAIFITLFSFNLISVSFLSFLFFLIFGNLAARLIYEALLMFIMICKNTAEIKKNTEGLKTKNTNSKKES